MSPFHPERNRPKALNIILSSFQFRMSSREGGLLYRRGWFEAHSKTNSTRRMACNPLAGRLMGSSARPKHQYIPLSFSTLLLFPCRIHSLSFHCRYCLQFQIIFLLAGQMSIMWVIICGQINSCPGSVPGMWPVHRLHTPLLPPKGCRHHNV